MSTFSSSESSNNKSLNDADARIVKTVRKLQKSTSYKKFEQEEQNKQIEESKILNYFEEEKNRTTDEFKGNKVISKLPKLNSSINNNRILIDSKKVNGVEIRSTKQLVKIGNKKEINESYSKMLNYSEKNDYQKKITNQLSIDKYKLICLQLLKEDDEIRTGIDTLRIAESPKFIDDYLFNDLFFQYKLEAFLIHKNGNTKHQKEAFFKQEIKKIIDIKLLDIEFNKRMKNVSNSLDTCLKQIDGFSI